MGSGKLEAIWLKRCKGAPLDPVPIARAVAGRGLEGSARSGARRQVTLLDREAWAAAAAELGLILDPSLRRANLLVHGVSLMDSAGAVLRLGEVEIRVLGETRPCARMDRACPGLRSALDRDWRGGVFGEVISGGLLRVGDRVTLSRAER